MFLVLPMILAAMSHLVAAAEVFAGCFKPSVININGIFPRSYNTATITCPEVCRRLSSPQDIYAYSRVSTVQPNTSLCWCTTVQPDAAHLIADSSCPYPNLSAELIRQPPNWGWYRCFDFLAQGPTNNFTVVSLPECLTACSTYPNAYFSYLDNSNKLSCACYQRGPPFTVDQCGLGVYYHYYHSFGPSEFAKRRISSFEDAEQGQGLCPSGLRACRIREGDDYSFECIDAETELESCGGCIHGEVGTTDYHGEAVNCLSSPGIVTNNITCAKGQCNAFSCDEGYRLEHGQCVSNE